MPTPDTSKLATDLLGLFAGSPDDAFTASEIAKSLGLKTREVTPVIGSLFDDGKVGKAGRKWQFLTTAPTAPTTPTTTLTTTPPATPPATTSDDKKTTHRYRANNDESVALRVAFDLAATMKADPGTLVRQALDNLDEKVRRSAVKRCLETAEKADPKKADLITILEDLDDELETGSRRNPEGMQRIYAAHQSDEPKHARLAVKAGHLGIRGNAVEIKELTVADAKKAMRGLDDKAKVIVIFAAPEHE